MTNNRILGVTDAGVSFRYTDRVTGGHRRETVSGHEFTRRFLQHVLPAGFHKSLPAPAKAGVRYYGLWHAARRRQADDLRNTLLLEQPATPPNSLAVTDPAQAVPSGDPQDPPLLRRFPHCQTGHLRLLRQLSPARPQGP